MSEGLTTKSVPPRTERASRAILSAEILSVGSEITAGETRDTNASELARALTDAGVSVRRIQAIPDELDVLTAAFEGGLARADLVVSTGGLGPTPDDLTREAIAAAFGEEPVVDPTLEAWLRELWARRSMAFPEANLKQAWRIPSADALPNPNGTAPGWWAQRSDGRVVVAMPGPPREMRPMWTGIVFPRLAATGLGEPIVVRTLRLTGIGESLVADLIGVPLLGAANPSVATYARAEAVDVRIAARDERDERGEVVRSAAEIADEAEAQVRGVVGQHVWATGATTWAEAIEGALRARGWRLAIAEVGTRGALGSLLAEAEALVRAESAETPGSGGGARDVADLAARVRAAASADIAVAARVTSRGADLSVEVAVVSPQGLRREDRTAFLGGTQGRHRAAISAAAVLLEELREDARTVSSGAPRA